MICYVKFPVEILRTSIVSLLVSYNISESRTPQLLSMDEEMTESLVESIRKDSRPNLNV